MCSLCLNTFVLINLDGLLCFDILIMLSFFFIFTSKSTGYQFPLFSKGTLFAILISLDVYVSLNSTSALAVILTLSKMRQRRSLHNGYRRKVAETEKGGFSREKQWSDFSFYMQNNAITLSTSFTCQKCRFHECKSYLQ